MTYRDARELFDHWRDFPPEHESIAMLLRVYTTWEPQPRTEEEAIAAHRRSLEARWNAGAMNPQQLFAAMGGQTGALGFNGTVQAPVFPGIGPFPGAPKADG